MANDLKVKKKVEFVIFISILILLILTLIIVSKNDKIRYEQAKEKLENAISDFQANSEIEDVGVLKSTIKDDIQNSEILNPEALQLPLYTVVDGYLFEISENGEIKEDNIEDNQVIDNNIDEQENENNNTATNTVIDTSDSNNNIVKYSDETKQYEGITVSTTKDGVVTINGKTTKSLFIKISNNIKITSNSSDFMDWKNEDGVIIEKGTHIKQKVTILNNTVKQKGQINMVLRTQENEAIGILKLLENKTQYDEILNKDIIANYIFISAGLEIDNFKFKVEITKEKNESIQNLLKLQNETKTYNGIECITTDKGSITLNGTSTSKIFIKINNGMHITLDGNENTQTAINSPSIIEKGKSININIKEVEGSCITENESQEFNLVLKYNDGEIATNCKIKKGIFHQEVDLQKDIGIVYLFISEGIKFDRYVIEPNIKYNV